MHSFCKLPFVKDFKKFTFNFCPEGSQSATIFSLGFKAGESPEKHALGTKMVSFKDAHTASQRGDGSYSLGPNK